jgi:predicted AAA+ superfamily ATPase
MKKGVNIFRRELYLNKITPFIDKQIVKVLTGHRRVGKSYILYQLINIIEANNKSANIIYINKEDIAFDKIRNYEQLNDYVASNLKNDTKNYIFIDEIQMITDFHIAVKSWALDENNDIYITGSNSNLLSSDLANELGGRYIEFIIYSLSYLEFLDFHKLENSDDSLERYFRYGGLPYLIHLPYDDAVIKEYLSSKDRARRLENAVLNHLLYCGYNVKIGTLPPEEIDFVCTKNGETLYVQVTIELSSQETIDREFGNLLKIKDNYPKIVVSGERSFENTYEGIEHIYIRNFLSGIPSKSIIRSELRY